MEIKLTESRELIRIANELPITDLNLIREMFFPVKKDRAVFGESIDIEVRSMTNDLATLQHKNGSAKIVNKKGKVIATIAPPTIREKCPATMDFLLTYDISKVWGRTAQEIETMRGDALADILAMLKSRAENRIAAMASELIQTGKIVYTDSDDYNFELNMNWGVSLLPNLTGTTRWNQTTADIDGNLDTWAATIRENSAGPNCVLMGKNAFSAFSNNDKIKANFDRSNWRVGALSPNLQSAYQGTYKGLDIFTPSGSYVEVSGINTAVYHADKITLFNKEQAARDNQVLYGIIPEKNAAIGDKFFSKQWEEQDPSTIWTLLTTRPIPSLPVVGSVVTARVINAS